MFNRKKTTFLSLIVMSFILIFTSACKKAETYDLDLNSNEAIVEDVYISEEIPQEEEVIVLEIKKEKTVQEVAINFEDLNWRKYNNNLLAYSMDYPTIVNIMGNDLDQHVEFIGPLLNNEWWPRISVSHYDNNYYRLGEDVAVSEWVKPFPDYEIGEEITIAGLETIHYVQAKTTQAFAADYYYFIKDNQLYNISIIHSNDKQDWDLYNKILESFVFIDSKASEEVE